MKPIVQRHAQIVTGFDRLVRADQLSKMGCLLGWQLYATSQEHGKSRGGSTTATPTKVKYRDFAVLLRHCLAAFPAVYAVVQWRP
jgi:hypothetical protein